jgi:ribose 5-phosphate isomerase A
MKSTEGTAAAKRAAGERAAAAVTDGDTVGLGTGSTAAAAIRALGERVADGLDVTAVTTSHQSRAVAREAGVPLVELADTPRLDVAIDGADAVALGDEVGDSDADGTLSASPPLVKGGGAAHTREKIVAEAADRYLVVVDETKLGATLSHPVPLAIVPSAEATVLRQLRAAGGEPTLRDAVRKDGPVVTDDGSLVVDCEFGDVSDPAALAATLSALPGVVEHGLFVDVADAVVVGRDGGATVRSVE